MKTWRLSAVTMVFAALCAQASASEWVATWGAAPAPPSPAMGPFPATPGFNNQTIRQVVRISAGGDRVRVRFTNEYGTKPLAIGAARIALTDEAGKVVAGSERALTFGGKPGAIVPARAPMLSDAVDLPVTALSSLSISLYLPEETGACTCHATGMQTALVSDAGDFTAKAFEPKEKIQSRAFVSGVEVLASGKASAIAVLGDSISDGVGSTMDTNRRWPDLLAARLAARDRGKTAWGVVNLGISGNRLLNDGAGESALARFDRDVLALPGVDYVVIFLGVNDLGMSFGQPSGPMGDFFKTLRPSHPATAEAMIAGYRQLIDRAHARGLKVFGATIAPYEGAMYFSAEGEAARQAINTWIRSGKAFDAVLDFDAAFRDPAHPTQMAEGLHMGDHLHGNDAGYQKVASSIDLALFK
jgi:lysophospholipase L1-like esterase